MPPIVAPGVCQFTLHGTYLSRPWANVFHMDIDSDIASDRNDNIRDQAQVFLNEWIDHIRPLVDGGCTLTEVSWVDLDSLSGSTGSRSDATAPRVMPSSGSVAGSPYSSAIAVLVKKTTSGGRGSRPGRTFFAGALESQIEGNNLTSGTLTAWNTGAQDFYDGVNQSHDGAFDYDSRMVVLHAPGGVFESMATVTDFVPASQVATQRRRNRP